MYNFTYNINILATKSTKSEPLLIVNYGKFSTNSLKFTLQFKF